MSRRREADPRPVVEYEHPRLSVWHVLRRVGMRLLDIQV